jgi:hypothetical protein
MLVDSGPKLWAHSAAIFMAVAMDAVACATVFCAWPLLTAGKIVAVLA